MKDWDYHKYAFHYFHVEEMTRYIDKLEKLESPIERIAGLVILRIKMWLGAYNITIKQQEPIGNYRADFVLIYKPIHSEYECKIIIECDGHDFHEKTKEQVIRDKERDRFFTKEGYKILRYSGSELCQDPTQIFDDVSQLLAPDKHKEIFPDYQHNRNGGVSS